MIFPVKWEGFSWEGPNELYTKIRSPQAGPGPDNNPRPFHSESSSRRPVNVITRAKRPCGAEAAHLHRRYLTKVPHDTLSPNISGT